MQFEHPDGARSRLRSTIASMEQALAQLHHPADRTQPDALGLLDRSFTELVAQLSLGPEPALRSCPVCGKKGMRNARVCGFCWAKLTPPEPGVAED